MPRLKNPDYYPVGILCPGGHSENRAMPHWCWVSDYYPFGFEKPATSWIADSMGYRYGFNSQEKDDEIYGTGNSYTAEYWQYDARLGRRWNVDPVVKPWMSSYHSFSNKPITNIDPNGAFDDNYYIFEDGDIYVERTDDPTNTYTFVTGNNTHIDLGTYSVVKNTTQTHNKSSQTKDMVNLVGLNLNFIKNRETVGNEHYLGEDETASLFGAAYSTYLQTGKTTYLTQLNGLYSLHSGHGSLGDRIDIQYINIHNKGKSTWTTNTDYDEKSNQSLLDNIKLYGFTRAFTQKGSSKALKNSTFLADHYHHIHVDANGGIPARYSQLNGNWERLKNKPLIKKESFPRLPTEEEWQKYEQNRGKN